MTLRILRSTGCRPRLSHIPPSHSPKNGHTWRQNEGRCVFELSGHESAMNAWPPHHCQPPGESIAMCAVQHTVISPCIHLPVSLGKRKADTSAKGVPRGSRTRPLQAPQLPSNNGRKHAAVVSASLPFLSADDAKAVASGAKNAHHIDHILEPCSLHLFLSLYAYIHQSASSLSLSLSLSLSFSLARSLSLFLSTRLCIFSSAHPFSRIHKTNMRRTLPLCLPNYLSLSPFATHLSSPPLSRHAVCSSTQQVIHGHTPPNRSK